MNNHTFALFDLDGVIVDTAKNVTDSMKLPE